MLAPTVGHHPPGLSDRGGTEPREPQGWVSVWVWNPPYSGNSSYDPSQYTSQAQHRAGTAVADVVHLGPRPYPDAHRPCHSSGPVVDYLRVPR